jgi:hypothetical protein
LEVGAEGGFKLDLRLDCDPGRLDRDPGKQKLKGAVRTETYWRHYCQHVEYRPNTNSGILWKTHHTKERLHIRGREK